MGLIISSFIIMLIIEHNLVKVKSEEIKSEEKIFVTIENEFLSEVFDTVICDLEYLTETFDEDNSYENWKIFSAKNKIYDQIRFINKYGIEKIRINYDKSGSIVIPKFYLKNVTRSYYFEKTSNLKEGQVFVSQLDLNVENGKVQRQKPIIRFCTPVYNNGFQGIIVLNYSAQYLLDKIRDIAINSNGIVYLLNDKGYFLSSNDPDEEWGFMYEDKKDLTFYNRFPKEWEMMSGSGDIVTKNGLFTYTDIDINKKYEFNDSRLGHEIFYNEGNWKLVSYVNADSANGYYISNNIFSMIKHIITTKFYNIFLFIIVSFIITLLIIKNKISMLKIKYIYEFDSMTDVYNRRAGFMRLGRCITSIITNKNIALCFIDVNGLKEVNDKFGHNVGDELIITVVKKIKEMIRENDFVIRLGGDEFLIVLPRTLKEDAEKVWDRITQSYEEINTIEKRPYLISVSHGMAEINNIINEDGLEKLITQADDKMYEEKRIIKQNIRIIR